MHLKALDEEWFSRIKDIHDGLPLRLRTDNYSEAKDKFLSNKDENPVFSYPVLEDKDYLFNLEKLSFLKEDILSRETDLDISTLYIDRIEEKTKEINLARCAFELQNNNGDPSFYKELVESLYGAPEKDLFDQVTAIICRDISDVEVSEKNREAYALVCDSLGCGDKEVPLDGVPNIEGCDLDSERVLSSQEIFNEIRRVLDENNLKDWRIRYGKQGQLSFYVRTKNFVTPSLGALSARKITKKELNAIIAHEMVHVLRIENGLNSPLKLLSYGLAGSLIAEEGLASFAEQKIRGCNDYSGLYLYLACGLAYGYDGSGVKKDFKDVYLILENLFSLFEPDLGFENRAFSICHKVFRGTRSSDPGVVYNRQLAYREGNIKAHQNIEGEDVPTNFLAGKYDSFNPDQANSLERLGVI